MSETATVHVREVKVVKEGTNAKGKWTMYGLKDGNDDLFSWFNNRTLYDEAKAFEDKRAEIEFEVNDKGKNLKAIKDVAPTNGDTPPLGTGQYIKGQQAPTDARRILVCVAWERANELAAIEVRCRPSVEWTPQLIFEAAKSHADNIFVALARKSNPDLLSDEDIPF